MTPLTIESLARAIHEDNTEALKIVGQRRGVRELSGFNAPHFRPFERLSEANKEVRREQARLLFNRIMR